jgi:hypothetical protein
MADLHLVRIGFAFDPDRAANGMRRRFSLSSPLCGGRFDGCHTVIANSEVVGDLRAGNFGTAASRHQPRRCVRYRTQEPWTSRKLYMFMTVLCVFRINLFRSALLVRSGRTSVAA